MMTRLSILFSLVVGLTLTTPVRSADELKKLDVDRGVIVVLGAPDAKRVLQLAKQSQLIFYVQSDDKQELASLRKAADKAGLLGRRVYAEQGKLDRIHLANNLADGLIVSRAAKRDAVLRREILRVLHPGAKAIYGAETITKPESKNADDWSHPYHGPDNNPQSKDKIASGPFLTQFLCEPWYIPMPQVTVTAGGRVFKAFGHIALKRREWPWLNSLVAINGYNGTMLWKRKLRPGFMVHRNTLIATKDLIYLGDDKSCKRINARTGEIHDQIRIPAEIDKDGVFKWMALKDGILYALVGKKEKLDTVIKGTRTRPGWPWASLGKGYAGKYSWGFGRTLVAIDVSSRSIRWHYKSKQPIDSRALCMSNGKLFIYSEGNYLAAINSDSGKQIWKVNNKDVLKAIGASLHAQNPALGFASSVYAKANKTGIYFAGPQRKNLVAVSAYDGSLLWSYPHGNFQLILRDDGLYAMGRLQSSKKFDFKTGQILADLQCFRGNCTRATGTADSIFTRGYRHTGTMRLEVSGNKAKRIPLMRPACQDGVIASFGQLYWGPWMCDCNHSLVGMICLAPAAGHDFKSKATDAERLVRGGTMQPETPPVQGPRGWRHYRGSTDRGASSVATLGKVQKRWTFSDNSKEWTTAPISAKGLVYWSGHDGIVRAADAKTGELKWTFYTQGAVRFAPEFFNGNIYVGSSDGWVYAIHAVSGQLFWKFRVAPADRKILVHHRLISTWPVASGVVVHHGVVYAAAGIASYDGTHVVALNAITGKLIWQNNTSGRLAGKDRVTGVSVQGHLLVHNDRLYLAGGNVVSPAMYDLKTGKCLNKIENEWMDGPKKQKFPSGKGLRGKMFQRSPRGRELFVVDGRVRVFDQLLYSPPKYGQSRYFGGNFLQAANKDVVIRGTIERLARVIPNKKVKGKPVGVWSKKGSFDPQALALCKNVVVVAETSTTKPPVSQLRAVDLKSGDTKWAHKLPARAVSWGVAVDGLGRIAVTLENGQVIGFH